MLTSNLAFTARTTIMRHAKNLGTNINESQANSILRFAIIFGFSLFVLIVGKFLF